MIYHCKDCGRKFLKNSWKGRNPIRCPACRENIKDKWRKDHPKDDKEK